MNHTPARLLIIAGSDSSGGAGIQADIKTATALGVFAMTAVTAVTVQDMSRLHAIHAVPAAMVREQISCVLADIGADAIKIGMLGSRDIVVAVADALAGHAAIPIVIDPVLASTSGAPLLESGAIDIMMMRLFPLAALVTPNLPETEHMTGTAVSTETEIITAAQQLRKYGAPAILVKGGHAGGERVRDILVTKDGIESFDAPRIAVPSARGTGCTLSTAIACELARGESLSAAVRQARNYLRKALESAPDFGTDSRPLNHMHNISDK